MQGSLSAIQVYEISTLTCHLSNSRGILETLNLDDIFDNLTSWRTRISIFKIHRSGRHSMTSLRTAHTSLKTKYRCINERIWTKQTLHIPQIISMQGAFLEYSCDMVFPPTDKSGVLDWNMCYNIIMGICKGLHYLHGSRWCTYSSFGSKTY